MWQNIPAELRALPQWVISGPDKIPLNPRTGQPASVIDHTTWGSFDEAVKAGYKHIGYVLHENDPFTIIDLDNKINKPATPEQLERHNKILATFDSYTERSASGRGYHIIIRGKVPAGVHRDNVEVYSSARYMICTGNVVKQIPIKDFNGLLEQLVGEMSPTAQVELDESIHGLLPDDELVDMASKAVNGLKFDTLCAGSWQEMGYPSQSEADYALLAILAFYTQDNEQVRRLFRYSKLGQREKALRNDTYLNRCLSKIRAVQPPLVEVTGNLAVVLDAVNHPTPPPTTANLASTPPATPSTYEFTLPPGVVGELASYFYKTAVRPVPDIALAAAIGLTAGVVGRAFNVSETGLNQYIILLAKTGAGKEGAVTGIEKIIAAIRPTIPQIDEFIGPSAFASGQAMIKVLDIHPCFVSILGEFGLTLQQICDKNATSAQIMLRKVLLDLYSKSGWDKVIRSSVYSDAEKNTKVVQAPSVTLLAESTPETFFGGLSASHVAEGLIPRFSIIEYTGPRPQLNKNAGVPPPDELVNRFKELVIIALTSANNGVKIPVQISPEALELFDKVEVNATAYINETTLDSERQVWNRVHLKCLKLGALLAVGVDPNQPIVTAELAKWAISFIEHEVSVVSTRFKAGDVGEGDSKQIHDMQRVIESFYNSDLKTVLTYGVSQQEFKAGVIPYVYIQRRCVSLASFRKDRKGATGAIKTVLEELIATREIEEVRLHGAKVGQYREAKFYRRIEQSKL